MRFQGFIGPSYTLRSVNIDCQRCVNWFPEMNQLGTGSAVAALLSTPGLLLKATASSSGGVRALYTSSAGVLYAVIGATLYEVSSAWALTSRGTLLTASGAVQMADNGISVCLVDGTYGYVLTLATNAFAQITDVDFHGAACVGFLDGYFLFNWPGTGKFYYSNLYGTDFDALDFATAEGAPDPLRALLIDHREIWLFGRYTTEVWFNSGALDNPFSRIDGAFIEHGIAAAQTAAKLANTVYWVGEDDRGGAVVWSATGYQPQRISTFAVELAIQSYGDISSARAYTYQQDGHPFYCLNFPNAATTWVYDASNGLWHERAAFADGAYARHRADCYAWAYNTHVVGDYALPKIYAYDLSTYTDNGGVIRRMRRAPHINSGRRRLVYHKAELDMETGVGLVSGQGSDPQVMLRWSDDGGSSFGSEYWVGSGKLGARQSRAIWRRLGASRDRVFEVAVSDPVKSTLIGMELELTEAAS